MGGLLTKTLLQDPGDILVRKASGKSWTEVQKMCTPEQRKLIEDMALYQSVPFVRRVLFLAVPHRGSKMAQYMQVRMIARLIKLPAGLVNNVTGIVRSLAHRQNAADKIEIRIRSGLEGLSPKDHSLRAIQELPLRTDVPCHSIIGNNKAATPGGTDGVVEYWSSHLDQVQSELMVQSGHSVQQHPVAIYEVRRILLEHLNAEKICDTKPLTPVQRANAEKPASHKDAPDAARQ